MKKEKILLGTPTYEGKAYCLEYWLQTVKQIQKYSKCDVLIVDNSKSSAYANKIKKFGFNVIRSKHYDRRPLQSLTESQEKLFDYAIRNNYDYLFSLEQDVFASKDIIEKLLKLRKKISATEAVVGAPYFLNTITESKSPYIWLDQVTSVALKREYNSRMRRKIQINMTQKELRRRKKYFSRLHFNRYFNSQEN